MELGDTTSITVSFPLTATATEPQKTIAAHSFGSVVAQIRQEEVTIEEGVAKAELADPESAETPPAGEAESDHPETVSIRSSENASDLPVRSRSAVSETRPSPENDTAQTATADKNRAQELSDPPPPSTRSGLLPPVAPLVTAARSEETELAQDGAVQPEDAPPSQYVSATERQHTQTLQAQFPVARAEAGGKIVRAEVTSGAVANQMQTPPAPEQRTLPKDGVQPEITHRPVPSTEAIPRSPDAPQTHVRFAAPSQTDAAQIDAKAAPPLPLPVKPEGQTEASASLPGSRGQLRFEQATVSMQVSGPLPEPLPIAPPPLPQPPAFSMTSPIAFSPPPLNTTERLDLTTSNSPEMNADFLPQARTSEGWTPTLSSFGAGSATAVTLRADSPNMPHRMAEILVSQAGQSVEVAMRPDELGSVRMVLSLSDTGATVFLNAERPETLDLMRRHADALAEALRQLGHESVDFSFGKEHQPSQGTDTRKADEVGTHEEPDQTTIARSGYAIGVQDGLDLRL